MTCGFSSLCRCRQDVDVDVDVDVRNIDWARPCRTFCQTTTKRTIEVAIARLAGHFQLVVLGHYNTYEVYVHLHVVDNMKIEL